MRLELNEVRIKVIRKYKPRIFFELSECWPFYYSMTNINLNY